MTSRMDGLLDAFRAVLWVEATERVEPNTMRAVQRALYCEMGKAERPAGGPRSKRDVALELAFEAGRLSGFAESCMAVLTLPDGTGKPAEEAIRAAQEARPVPLGLYTRTGDGAGQGGD